MKKKLAKLEDLTLDPRNPNKHTPRGAAMVERSLTELGAGRGVSVSADGVVLAGNLTVETAVANGFGAVVVETDGHEFVVVQREDLHSESPEAIAMKFADNRSSEVGIEWDTNVLAEVRAAKLLDAWFAKGESDAMLGKEAEVNPTQENVVAAVVGQVIDAPAGASPDVAAGAAEAAGAPAAKPRGPKKQPVITVVFRSRKESAEFMTQAGLDPEEKYVSGVSFDAALRAKAKR